MDLFHYWNEFAPPTGELVAAYLGFERKGQSRELNSTDQQVLMAMGPARPWNSLPEDVRKAFDEMKAEKLPN